MASEKEEEPPVLHVVVVGFHHKKGCQVEYSYPPLVEGQPVDSHEVPAEWKHLPSLALPDGAHNYTQDTVFFHLPSRNSKSNQTVYGVSCYRQMDAKDLVNRGADVTRNTVQKSVCVLSRLPLYGLIQAKLELITHAYFDEKDFSQTSLLHDTYTNMNASLAQSLLQHGSQVFLGLSCRELVHQLKHKALILFKLMLLERKVLFFSSPVQPICTTLLSIISLFPDMVEHGLNESARYLPSNSISPTLHKTRSGSTSSAEDFLEVRYTSQKSTDSTRSCPLPTDLDLTADFNGSGDKPPTDQTSQTCDSNCDATSNHDDDLALKTESISMGSGEYSVAGNNKVSFAKSSPEQEKKNLVDDLVNQSNMERLLEADDEALSFEEDKLMLEIDAALEEEIDESTPAEIHSPVDPQVHYFKGTNECSISTPPQTPSEEDPRRVSLKRKKRLSTQSSEESQSGLEVVNDHYGMPVSGEGVGFPLAIFTKGVLCHPYLCLQNYDLLNDVNVRGFVVGATNMLFKQKRHLIDVIVELGEGQLEMHDSSLRRQLSLTTADLRFVDYLVSKCTSSSQSNNLYLESTGWEGGDEWVRAQFLSYLTSMLATVSRGDERAVEDFNSHFVAAWKTTHNHKVWRSGAHPGLDGVMPLHPFHGNIGMSDVRLRFSHSMQNTERGKKINAAVSQTGRVVGGAISSAKNVVSSWFRELSREWHDEEESEEDS